MSRDRVAALNLSLARTVVPTDEDTVEIDDIPMLSVSGESQSDKNANKVSEATEEGKKKKKKKKKI